MNLKKNDMVRVVTPGHARYGDIGTVSFAYSDWRFVVRFADGREIMALPSELEPVDTKREGLLQLATTLNKARIQANAVEATAPQHGVYGDISQVLVEVLCLLTGRFEVGDIYDALLDGCTVRKALALVVK